MNSTLDIHKIIADENIINEEKSNIPSTTRVNRGTSEIDEIHRRYLSKKISEVLFEIDSINRESKFFY